MLTSIQPYYIIGLQDKDQGEIIETLANWKKEDRVLVMWPAIFNGGLKVIDHSENLSVHQ